MRATHLKWGMSSFNRFYQNQMNKTNHLINTKWWCLIMKEKISPMMSSK
jgi:hypothetical protein